MAANDPVTWLPKNLTKAIDWNVRQITKFGLATLPFVGCFFIIDFVLLATKQESDSCQSINDKPIGIDIWILVGCVTSMVWMFGVGIQIAMYVGSHDFLDKKTAEQVKEMLLSYGPYVNAGIGCVVALFYLIWGIIGIMVYINMDKDYDEYSVHCANAVIAWIVLKFCSVICLCGIIIYVFCVCKFQDLR